MSGAEGPIKVKRTKRWCDSRIKKKECNRGDKWFMNKIHNQPSKESFHKMLRCQHTPTLRVTSQGK